MDRLYEIRWRVLVQRMLTVKNLATAIEFNMLMKELRTYETIDLDGLLEKANATNDWILSKLDSKVTQSSDTNAQASNYDTIFTELKLRVLWDFTAVRLDSVKNRDDYKSYISRDETLKKA